MKKAKSALIIATMMICIFACGFLLGRNLNNSKITVMSGSQASTPTGTSSTASQKININTATIDELTILPGIGRTLAQRIIDYRETIGPFRTVSDLCNVEGIGDQKLDLIYDYIII